MSKTTNEKLNKKLNKKLNNEAKRNPQERIFIVNESYAGIRNLSDIFADLLYSAYCKTEPDDSGNENNCNGYLPTQTGQDNYAGV